MKIHAIQTGFVRIKTAQVEGRGHGLARRLAVFTDCHWTDWLPTYAWAIEHREGVIVVDTGQGTHLLETGKSRFPIPITAESKNADLDCTIWGIKRPDGKFFFPAGANAGISKEKLSKFALLMETESLGEKLAFQGRSNGDVGHRLQTPEVVLAPQ